MQRVSPPFSTATAYTWTALQTFSNGLTVSAGTTALQATTATTLTCSSYFRTDRSTAGDLFSGFFSGAYKFQMEVDGSGNPQMNMRNAAGTVFALWNTTGLALGATGLIGSERVRVTGGTMPTPGALDVCLAAGRVYAGDTGATSIQTAGGITSALSITNSRAGVATISNTCTAAGTANYARTLQQCDTTAKGYFDCYSSTFATSIFGTSAANATAFLSDGAALTAFFIGVYNVDKPVIFGINTSEVARLTSGTLASGSLAVKYTTASTSTTTGALTVAGGLGVAGTIYATNGYLNASSATGGRFAIGQDAAGSSDTNAALQICNGTTPAKLINIGYDGAADYGFIQAVHQATALKGLAIQPRGGSLGFFGATPVAQATGFGTPTGASRLANFPGATATLTQTTGAVADMIAIFKALGLFGA